MSLGHGASVVRDGLVLYLDAANSKSYNPNLIEYSENFSNPYWSKNSGIVLTSTNEFAPNGKQTATTLEDTSTTLYQSISRSITVPNDSQIYSLSIFVRKTSGGTAPGFAVNTRLSGGTQVASNQRLNTDTGVVTSASVLDLGNYWRMHWTITNNSSGNTSLGVNIFPAARLSSGGGDTVTAIGTATIWGMMIARGSTLLDYVSNAGKSSDIWYDQSGQGNTGTLVNGVGFNSDNNGSLVFDGINDYVNLGNSTWSSIFNNIIGNNFSLRCIIKPSDIGTAQALISQRHGDAMSLFLLENGKVTLEMDDTQTYNGTTTVLDNNNWYDIAVTFENNTSQSRAYYYVNGQFERSEIKWDGNGTTVNNNLWIGWQSRTNYNINPTFFKGDISNVQIYNRALTANEVQQNFAATRGRFGI